MGKKIGTMDNEELVRRSVEIARIQRKIDRLEAWGRFIRSKWFDRLGLVLCIAVVYGLIEFGKWAWALLEEIGGR